MRPEDRVGTIINGNAKVLRLIGKDKHHNWKVEAECQHCGNIFIVNLRHLMTGETKSCGCIGPGRPIGAKGEKSIESIGKIYGEVKVINLLGVNKKVGSMMVTGECQHCEDKTLFIVQLNHLKEGSTKSCGCLNRERLSTLSAERCGPNSPAWMGGLSFAPYCEKFNNKLKERIRDEYGRRCFLCNMDEEENGQRLSIHHTDYDKEQGCSGKGLALVPLCQSCHAKTNSNREYWTNLFNTALKAIYEVATNAEEQGPSTPE
jgi:hypothetical protein